MKLFLISQTQNRNLDTYDSAIVCAEDEAQAKRMSPSGESIFMEDARKWEIDAWCKEEFVMCEYLGEAKDGLKLGVVCSSFNPW